MATTSLNHSAIIGALAPQIESTNQAMVALLDSLEGPELGAQDLLQIQTRLQQLQTVTNLHSTLIKSLGDLFKEILQKTN